MSTVGFIGLGSIGYPMARCVMRGNYALRAFDIDPAATRRIADAGATPARSARDAAEGADFVITMVPDGPDVEEAVFGESGLAEGLASGALYINMSTIHPDVTVSVARRLRARGSRMLDAPVGLSTKHAERGELLIMAGGESEDLEHARPVLEQMGNTIRHCGPVGAGSTMKVVNNFMAGTLQALTAETLNVANAAGLDLETAMGVLRMTAESKGFLDKWPGAVLAGNLEPGFPLDHAVKDLGLAVDLAARRGVPVPIGAAALQWGTIGRNQGRGRQDSSCVYEVVRSLSAKDSGGLPSV